MSSGAVIVIPARFGSSRLPGKPLLKIRGRTMIERVWSIARAVPGVGGVVVATDDQRIVDEVVKFGGDAVLTPVECRNGTERVLEAVRSLKSRPDVVVNFQGDTPLTPPWVIEPLVGLMKRDAAVEMATPCVRLSWAGWERAQEAKKKTPFSGTYVTFDRKGRALYFSKSLIPAIRERAAGDPPVYQHIGIYAYRTSLLERYVTLPPTPLEISEGLEQLRALENGIAIQMVEVDYRGRTSWAVDSPEDAAEVERILEREGELLP